MQATSLKPLPMVQEKMILFRVFKREHCHITKLEGQIDESYCYRATVKEMHKVHKACYAEYGIILC